MEMNRLIRLRAQAKTNDRYEDMDFSFLNEAIQRQAEILDGFRNMANSRGETGSGGPPDISMVVVTNGKETLKIPRSDLGAAMVEGFREQ